MQRCEEVDNHLRFAFRFANVLAIAFAVIFSLAQSPVADASAPPMLIGFWEPRVDAAGAINADKYNQAAQYSNLVMVQAGSVGDIVTKVQQAASIGRNSLIVLSDQLFPSGSVVPYPLNVPGIRSYQDRFNDLWAALQPNNLQSKVAGFLIYDEPYFVNGLGTDAKSPWQNVRQGLDAVAGYAKKMTGLPNLMLFSHPEVKDSRFANSANPQLAFLPENVDYFGVNCYLAFEDACSEAEIRGMMVIMKNARKPHQKFLFSMDGWYWASQQPLAHDQAINQRIRFWMRLIGDNLQLTGGVLSFIYQNVPAENIAGLESLPQSFDVMASYMLGLQNKAWCTGNDLFTSSGGRRADAPYCVPICEGHDYTRRSLQGEVIDKWTNAPVCP